MRLSLAVALVAASVLQPGSAQPAPDPPVHAVRIDAIASDARGEVVANLNAADFAVREDGVLQTLESAQFSATTPGPRPPRLFGMFLDEYHVTAGDSSKRAREALGRFVDEELGPDDLLVVMKPLDSLFTIRPTRDREAARQAIATFEGRRGDYQPQSSYERNYIAGSPARIEAARLQVAVSAINALAVELGRLGDARKTVIVVSEALASPAQPGPGSAPGNGPGLRGREYLATVDTVVRSADRANASIYVVDSSPSTAVAAADGDRAARDGMRGIATSTAGAVIAGADLDGGLRRVVRDSSGYYRLTYRSAHKEDGRFHPVEVRVKRASVQVRAPAGYWAPSPDDTLRARLVEEANQPPPVARVEPPRHISSLIRPWFGLARGDDGKTRVTFVWEAAGRVPGNRTLHYPARVILTVLGADDAVIFEGPILPGGSVALEEGAGAMARAVFDAPPGKVRLRMRIEDETSQAMDSDVRDLAVRDWHAAVALGTPEVLRARNLRELRSIEADPDAVPVASREFSRAEHLLIRFVAYVPPRAEKTMTAELLGPSGQAMRALTVDGESIPDGRKQVDVPLAGLAPGNYSIELSVKCAAGTATDRLDFRVTS